MWHGDGGWRINLPDCNPVIGALQMAMEPGVAMRFESADHRPFGADLNREPRLEVRLVLPQLHEQAIRVSARG
jgi:hypothetical protein